MKKLNITKEQFNRSRYFKNKYGKLEYVSESGRLFKTNKGKVLKFKESFEGYEDDEFRGDGMIHVFDYGEDYPFEEAYRVILPSGEVFCTNNSYSPTYNVSYWEDGNIGYSTQSEMEDELTEEHDGVEYRPTEIGLDSIPNQLKKIIMDYAERSKCKTDYEDVMNLLD